nr:MAG TPA: hypothetical protein [Bacteriophage sp.]
MATNYFCFRIAIHGFTIIISCNLDAITICRNINILAIYNRSWLRKILITPNPSVNIGDSIYFFRHTSYSKSDKSQSLA